MQEVKADDTAGPLAMANLHTFAVTGPTNAAPATSAAPDNTTTDGERRPLESHCALPGKFAGVSVNARYEPPEAPQISGGTPPKLHWTSSQQYATR